MGELNEMKLEAAYLFNNNRHRYYFGGSDTGGYFRALPHSSKARGKS